MAARSSEEVKRQIKDANDILGVVRSYGIELKRAGRNWKACCPFHQEKTPSFNVNPEGQYFKCFGCGKSGDVFSFVALQERVEFPEALRLLADRAGIELQEDPQARARYRQEKDWKSYLYRLNSAAASFYQRQLMSESGRVARTYLNERGISEESWEQFQIGYAPRGGGQLMQHLHKQRAPVKAIERAGLVNLRDDGSPYDYFRDRLMFPITDSQGRVIGFGGRVLGEGEPKYLNTRETLLFKKSQTVYGIAQARDTIVDKRCAVLVEGYTDVIMCHQHGVKNVVAALGTAITADHVRVLRRQADELALVTDSDAAGAKASERSVDILFQEDMPATVVRLPGQGKDPCDFLTEEGQEAFEEALAQGASLFDFKFSQVTESVDISSPAGQTTAAREMMRVVSLSPDPIRKAAYRRDVSARLNLPEEELEFSTPRSPTSQPIEPDEGMGDEEIPKPENALAHAERELLRWAFHQPAWLETLLGDVDLTTLCGRLERRIGIAIFRAMDEGRLPPEVDTLAQDGRTPAGTMAREVLEQLAGEGSEQAHDVHFPDRETELARRLCILLAEESPEHKRLKREEAYEMRLHAVKQAKNRYDMDALRRTEAAARAAGDEEKAGAIAMEIVALQKQMMELKRGLAKANT